MGGQQGRRLIVEIYRTNKNLLSLTIAKKLYSNLSEEGARS